MLKTYDVSSSEGISDEDVSEEDSVKTSEVVQVRGRAKQYGSKLPAFTGKEDWKVWFNRFRSVADLNEWTRKERLQELLPRIQGTAAEFVFGQLKPGVTANYKLLTKEIEGRFGSIETPKTYITQFSRRNQKNGETPKVYAAELKKLYDKAYPKRGAETRQEDLVRKFLMGLLDDQARIYVELHKEPQTIEEAVSHVTHYTEATDNPRNNDEDGPGKYRKQTRQVKQEGAKAKRPNYGSENKRTTGTEEIGEKSKEKLSTIAGNQEKGDKITVDKEELQNIIQEMMKGQRNTEVSVNVARKGHDQSWGGQTNSNRNIVCYHCGQPGHYARNCYSNPNRIDYNRPRDQEGPSRWTPQTRTYGSDAKLTSPQAREWKPTSQRSNGSNVPVELN